MPTDVHPLLRPKEEVVEPAAEAAVLEETPTEAPVPEPVPEAPVVEEPKPRRVIDLEADDLYAQIQRFSAEDPKFQNVLNSYIGRKVARDYSPRLTQLEAEKARLEQRLHELEMQGMDDEAINAKLRSDPEFRQRYGQKPAADPAIIEARGQFNAAVARAEDAVAAYLDLQELTAFRQSLASGWFNAERDAQGNPIRALSAQESLVAYQAALHDHARKKLAARQEPKVETPSPAPQPQAAAPVVEAPAQPPPKPAPVANTRLAQLSPDLTTTAPQTGQVRMSLSEYRNLTPPQRQALYPKAEDYEAARRQGIIYDD